MEIRDMLVGLCVMTVFGTGGPAGAQVLSSPRSPADRITTLLRTAPVPAPGGANADTTPAAPDPAAVWGAMTRAIDMARAIRGAADGAAGPQALRTRTDAATARLRRVRVAADDADTADEWTRALSTGMASIVSVLERTPDCTSGKKEPSLPASLSKLVGADQWVSGLEASYCVLRGQLVRGWDVAGETPTARAVSYLPFAGLAGGTAKPQVSVQAAELFLSNRWRVYLRSTLQATTQPAADSTKAGADAVDDKVRSAMLDPFGGTLNLTGGYYRKLPTPFLDGHANDAEHGVFADVRGGFKLIELPEQTLTLTKGPTAVTPFTTASAGVRMRLPVYADRERRTAAGSVELGAAVSMSRISDTGASALFTGVAGAPAVLPQNVRAAHLSVALQLSKVANIALSATTWSNTDLKRRVIVEMNLVQSKE